jgi:hypothetical protein
MSHFESRTPPVADGPYFRCLEHFETGMRAMFTRPSDWIGPALVFGGLSIIAAACCCLPGLVVQGPLSCGLYACALAAVRGLPFETQTLARGWELAGRSIVAALWVYLVPGLVAFVVIALPLAGGMGLLAYLGTEAEGKPAPLTLPLMLGLWLQVGLLGIVAMLGLSWFHARALFVLPLIADRGLAFRDAFHLSWNETRRRFWDVWALHLLGGLVVAMTSQVCTPLGVLIGLPLYHCVVAAAYEERFASGAIAA